MKTYNGGCHCGGVTYRVHCRPESGIECNCSHCSIKGMVLTFVPKEEFTLLTGQDLLTEYRFNTKKIQHVFCRKCGVQSFSRGNDTEGNEIVCINLRCLDGFPLDQLPRIPYNGREV